MYKGFWETIKKPVIELAPMEDVSDNAFRQIITEQGKPDVMYTEFTSADGLMSVGREKVIHRFEYNESQRPIVAQIFTKFPEKMIHAVELCVEMGFDGVDINMGCPKDNMCRNGACAGMIRTPDLAKEVIRAAQKGAQDQIPVTVKTRLGYSRKDEAETWIKHLLETEIPKLTVHGRTKKEMSKPPADWDAIGKVVELRDSLGAETLIVGNGDIKSYDEAMEKVRQYNVDGVMIGRGIFGNPWVFNKNLKKEDLSPAEILKVVLRHTQLYDEYYTGRKNFHYMRKFFKAYVSGIPNNKELLTDLMQTNNSQDVRNIVENYLENN